MNPSWMLMALFCATVTWSEPTAAVDDPLTAIEREVGLMEQSYGADSLSEALYHGMRAIERMEAEKEGIPAQSVAAAHMIVGDILLRLNKMEDALTHFHSAYQLADQSTNDALRLRRNAASKFSSAALDMGKWADPEVVTMAQDALRIDRMLGGDRVEEILEDLRLLADVHVARGELRKGLDYLLEFDDGVTSLIGPGDPRRLVGLYDLANLYLALEEHTNALTRLDEAETILARNPNIKFGQRIRIAMTRARLSCTPLETEQCVAALKQVEKAYAFDLDRIPPKDRAALADAYMSLGDIHFGRKEWAAAEDYFRSALREKLVSGNLDDFAIPLALFKLGQVAGVTGEKASQLRLYRRSFQLLADKTEGETLPQMRSLVETLISIAQPVLLQNKVEDALASVNKLRGRLHNGKDDK